MVTGEGTTDPNAREIVRYCEAMLSVSDEPISIGMLERICSVLRQEEVRIRGAGEQVYLRNPADDSIVYTPPEGATVYAMMDRLLTYISDAGIDPLFRMAVSHAVFESIHPFMDGNGRTGRILNILILMKNGLLDGPVLFLSRYLMDNRRDYYRYLRRLQRDNLEKDWKDWLVFVFDGITAMSRKTLEQTREIESLHNAMAEDCSEMNGFPKELEDMLFSRVHCNTGFPVDAGIAETAFRRARSLTPPRTDSGRSRGDPSDSSPH